MPSEQVHCENCHQFMGHAALHFCNAACTHEWSSKVIEGETPLQIWRIIELSRKLLVPDAQYRAIIIGKLVQQCRETWPESEVEHG